MTVVRLSARERPSNVSILPTSWQADSRWTPGNVRCALDAHEQGDFYRSALLSDALGRDPDIQSALGIRCTALVARGGLPFCVEPSEGVDDRRAPSIAKTVQGLWWTSCPEAEVCALQRDEICLGVAVGRVEWTMSSSLWIPRLRRLRPQGLRWHEWDRAYHYLDGSGTDHVVTPGQNGWVLHAPSGGDPWMQGLVRPLGLLYVMRQYAQRDFARYSERHGLPALLVTEPQFASDDIDGQKAAFYARFQNIGSEAVIGLPAPGDPGAQGTMAKWLELTSQSHDAFLKHIEDLRRSFIAAILGRDPSTASSVGGDGAGVLERVRNEHLVRDAEGLSTTLRDQVWKPFVQFNYDPAKPELAPWGRWQTRPPGDLAKRAQTISTLATVPGLMERIDLEALAEEFHLPLKRVEQP